MIKQGDFQRLFHIWDYLTEKDSLVNDVMGIIFMILG